MSKSARAATPSSRASRSSLTPPAESNASPRNTPTPLPKSKPQKSKPPRSNFGVRRLAAAFPSSRSALFFAGLPLVISIDRIPVGQPLLAVPLSFRVPQRGCEFLPKLSALLCALSLSALSLIFLQILAFDFQLSTVNFPSRTMNFHRGYPIPHV